MSYLKLTGLSKSYGSGEARKEILRKLDLEMAEGEFLALVGFSGSGKTTLMQIIAGLLKPDAGEVVFRGKAVEMPSPERALVFQNYSLLPWLTVAGNVELAVRRAFPGMDAKTRHDHVVEHLEMVSLGRALHKRPAQLSGGMRQRVSVARALAMRPKLLLLDEPLSALDALTRSNIQGEILKLQEEHGISVLMITNDVDEALFMADRVIPLTPKGEESLGPTFTVDIPRPRNKAAMNGSPRYRELRASLTSYLLSQMPSEADARPLPPAVLERLKPAHAA